jgi:hypothetical protein
MKKFWTQPKIKRFSTFRRIVVFQCSESSNLGLKRRLNSIKYSQASRRSRSSVCSHTPATRRGWQHNKILLNLGMNDHENKGTATFRNFRNYLRVNTASHHTAHVSSAAACTCFRKFLASVLQLHRLELPTTCQPQSLRPTWRQLYLQLSCCKRLKR